MITIVNLFFFFDFFFTTSDTTSTTSGNKTNFTTGTCITTYTRPAFKIGLSIRPPPAMIPTIARLDDCITFLAPDGSLIRVF
ncbi:hypothetical protein DERP_010202 [Dermatophagoides pteronyssinus]|uniref:Secreted protein n=1 Tax=Dermatophagoides pteronyssinus TaxID=6956 RepID=A0ABQ8J7F7_DERPT|nr:hypothetical protein DERP_010202 [Dermatophagoides pteronyssinus]